MSVKKRGLGKGLDALLGGIDLKTPAPAPVSIHETPAGAPAQAQAPVAGSELRRLPIEVIQRGKYQPRVDMRQDSLEDLASSIRAQGVIQPVVVRPLGEGRYELIAGERRWRAAQLAGLEHIPAVVRHVPDQAAMAMALIENIQRENLNPIEEAQALQRLSDEFDLTHEQVAETVGRSRAAVTNLMRLLELGEEVRHMVERRELDMGHARALLSLRGKAQLDAARHIASKGLSVRETENYIRHLLAAQGQHKKPSSVAEDPDIRRFQAELSERLGARIELHYNAKGAGKLVVHFNSLDELEGVVERIK